MARRQTYREGPPTPEEYDDIFDSDPAEWTPYYNKRYEGHLYRTEQEKAREIFRLLRALDEHLDEQDRNRRQACHRQLQYRHTDDETAAQQDRPTIPPLFVEIDQPKGTHTIIGTPFSPRRRPTTTEVEQPETNEPTPSETASEASQRPHEQNPLIHRNGYSELVPMQMNSDQAHTISTGELEDDEVTASRRAKPTDGQQTEVSIYATQAIDVDPGSEATTTLTAEPMKPPRPPRMRNSTLKEDKEHYDHTLRDPAIRVNEHSQTPLNSSTSPLEGSSETYLYWQPMNANASNPGTKPTANHAVDKLPPIPHPEEPFTGRDTKVIPDRGKSFRRS